MNGRASALEQRNQPYVPAGIKGGVCTMSRIFGEEDRGETTVPFVSP
jgi:hypothetical protein